jgi:hypothetical protein
MFNNIITAKQENRRVSVRTRRLRNFLWLSVLMEELDNLCIFMHWYRAQKQHTRVHVATEYKS